MDNDEFMERLEWLLIEQKLIIEKLKELTKKFMNEKRV